MSAGACPALDAQRRAMALERERVRSHRRETTAREGGLLGECMQLRLGAVGSVFRGVAASHAA